MPERDYQFSSIASTILDDAKQECDKCFETLAPVGGKLQTAWSIKHKLLQTMLLREEQRCLDGRVETDDAYLGGKKQGKRGRGAAGKTPFVAAIQTNNKGKPHFMCLTPVAGFTHEALRQWPTKCLASTAHGVSDGLWCFGAVTHTAAQHQHHFVRSGNAISFSMTC